jgi:glutathione S-transferase
MKLYDSIGPNPRVVRMFAAEKGLTIDLIKVDIMGGENRQAAYLSRNPAGQMPALELDDGVTVCEVTAICEYLEDIHPTPALIGSTPREKAECRMWLRRADLNIIEPLANGFRFAEGLPLFASRIPCEPEAAPGLKRIAQNRMQWLSDLANGRVWLCGDRFTLADIHLFCFLDFAIQVGQPINPQASWMLAFYDRAKARPSAGA